MRSPSAPAAGAARLLLLGLFTLSAVPAAATAQEAPYDVVISGGRVMDPESGLDAVRHIGIRDGRIAAISEQPLEGRTVLDAAGQVVAPGFIDLHVHLLNQETLLARARDGVTTALELEVGTDDVEQYLREREGHAVINYGVSAGHIGARITVFDDPSTFLPSGPGARAVAGPDQLRAVLERIRAGLRQGALGVGMGLQYTPAATRWEVLEVFRLARQFGVPVFAHVRAFGEREPGGSVESFLEVIGAAAVTGASLHIVHLNSMSLGTTPATLQLVREARQRGLDVTTEAYPYSAGMTAIESALLDQYEGVPDSVLRRLEWAATGERLNAALFRKYRATGGNVVLHLNTPDMEAMAIEAPFTMVASDGELEDGVGHPRTAGTSARLLGYYVRERQGLTLMDALRKLTLWPAERLETMAPMFRQKGRIRVGADADITVFDPVRVIDRSTYREPTRAAEGFRHVLVNGVPVLRDGAVVEGVYPGRPARAPAR